MFIEFQSRICMSCGHVYSHILGGIILNLHPKCPKCGSRHSIKYKKKRRDEIM